MKKILLTLPVISALIAAPFALNAAVVTSIATQDTFVRSDSPNDAFGTATTLLVGDHASAGPFNSFFKFQLTAPELTGATINSVSLQLTSVNEAGSGSININLYQLSAANADWKEGVSGTVPTGTGDTGATFNNKAGQGASAVAWAGGNTNANLVAGADYVNTVLGNYTGATNNVTGGQTFDWGNASLATLVQSSIGGQLDLILMGQTGANTNFLRIASSENGTYAAPQLIIDYTPVPEPGTVALYAGAVALGLILYRRRRS